MDRVINHPSYACQTCGSVKKIVDYITGDEVEWSTGESRFIDIRQGYWFEATGYEWCASCHAEWTGS